MLAESPNKKDLTSLILSPVKRNDDIESRNTNRQMTDYDPVAKVTGKTNIRFIDDVWLSEEEIAQIPECLYEREIGRLWLRNGINELNVIRCEQRYKYTTNIKRITHHLTGLKDTNELTFTYTH